MNNFDIIIKKLEVFIKKYYLFKMLRGLFLIIGLSILGVLSVSLIEYFNYLDVKLKTVIFYSSIILFLVLLTIFFLLPLLAIFKLKKNLSYSEAAIFISKHFTEIDDKLLNALELNNIIEVDNKKSDLLIASINQRTVELSPFVFHNAVNYDFLRSKFWFFAISILLMLLIYFLSPKIVTEGTSRLLDYSIEYTPALPFDFVLENNNLNCEKGKDFLVKMRIEGDYLPAEVFIKIGGNTFRMDYRKKIDLYEFELKNVNNTLDFNFVADNYMSNSFKINVLASPILKSFFIDVIPPSYTGVENSHILNAGDITVPFGTKIKWNFKTDNVNKLILNYNTDTTVLKSEKNSFEYSKIIKRNTEYSVSFCNDNFTSKEALKYRINIIPDNYPEISLKKVEDSTKLSAYYFMVSIKDDYGFKDLTFVCENFDGTKSEQVVKKKVNINTKTTTQNVFYYYDFSDLQIPDNKHIEYYFELRDNDFISGFKKVRTAVEIYKPMSKEDVASLSEDYENSVNSSINAGKDLAKDIRNEIENFKRRELSEKVSDWEKREILKHIKNKQLKLQEILKKSAFENQKKDILNNQNYEESQKILEKQKQLQQLMNEVMDDELKQLLKEIEDLSNKFDNNKFDKLKDKINMSYKDVDKKLERNIELLKRYQVEENVSKLAEDLQELSDKQDKISKDEDLQKDKNKLQEVQKEINDRLEKLKEQFNKIQEKNKGLKAPFKFDNFSDNFKSLKEKMNKLQNDIQKNSKKKNQKNQKEISKDIKKISEKMKSMMAKMNGMSLDVNMEQLRQVIDNLSIFSFSQEDNYLALQNNYKTSPKFLEIVRTQKKLETDYAIIKDSVESLASKVFMMSKLLTKETTKLQYDLEKVTKELEQRNGRLALTIQRQIITSANTLALYLDELMKQMKDQKEGKGSGSKEGGMTKKDMMGLKKQQQKLKKSLEKLLEEMRKNGGKKSGKGFVNQLVKTLAEQEVFNKMIDDLQKGKSLSPEAEKKLKEIRKMSEQNVQDLINKNIGNQLLRRNKAIKTRLLEAEKADRKQEEDKKRESKAGEKYKIELPPELKKSLEKNQKYKEHLNKYNLKFNKYYQNLTKEYFRQVSE